MGSPITLSGFNKIDFNVILEATMQQEQAPLQALQQQQQALQSQATAFRTLSTKVLALKAATDALTDPATFGGRTTSVTDSSAVSVTAGGTTPTGTYDIKVLELARAQVTRSSSIAPNRDTAIAASGGTLTIKVNDELVGVTVTIGQNKTLDGLAAAINGTANIGVVASVVNTAANEYRLVLTGKQTGTANHFDIVNGLTGGDAPTAFLDANSVNATNASAEVNGIGVTSATNSIEGAIPGATIALLKKDLAATITATVGLDTTSTKAKITDFVNSFNDLVNFATTQNASTATSSQSTIGRDALLRGLRSTLRDTLTRQYSGLGALQGLAAIGIEFQLDGKLKFKEATFNEVAKNNLADAAALVGGTSTTPGAFDAISTTLNNYATSGGLIPSAQARITTQLSTMGSRIMRMQERLAIRRSSLQQQMIAADMTISKLNSQGSALSQLGSSFGSF